LSLVDYASSLRCRTQSHLVGKNFPIFLIFLSKLSNEKHVIERKRQTRSQKEKILPCAMQLYTLPDFGHIPYKTCRWTDHQVIIPHGYVLPTISHHQKLPGSKKANFGKARFSLRAQVISVDEAFRN